MADKKFTIVADTTCDLTKAWYDENGARYAQHGIVLDGEEMWDDLVGKARPDFIMQSIRQGKKVTTLQVRLEDFEHMFTEICQSGKDAVYIAFSSVLSGTYATSTIAAKNVMEKFPGRKVYCVDSKCATMGQGILVMKINELCNQGMSAEEAVKTAEELSPKVCHFFTVDDLNHLYKGGRLSKSSAMMGTLMGIKPIMYISDEGTLSPIGKVRGRKASMKELAEHVKSHIVNPQGQTVYITHGDVADEAAELAQIIRETVPGVLTDIRQLSPVIGVHSGPGTLAVFCWGDKRL